MTKFTVIIFMGCGLVQAAPHVTHGPILGRVGPHEIAVWARTSEPGQFRVRYGLSPDRLDRRSSPARTSLERDNCGWVHIEGLEPGTRYYYELDAAEIRRPLLELRGSFRTLPAPGQFRDPRHNPEGLFNFSFEFACGNNQPANLEMPTFRTMLRQLKDEIHFAILNGDWLYEEQRDFPVTAWLRQVRRTPADTPRIVRLAPTITGVWENYKLYLERGAPLAEWHRQVPSFFTFDDHEILGDVNGAGSPGLRSRRAVFRDIGVQAWYDYLGWSNPVSHSQGIRFGEAALRAGSDLLHDAEADFTTLKLDQAATLMGLWMEPDAGVNEKHLDDVGGDANAGVYEIVEVLDVNRLRIRPAAPKDGSISYSIGRLNYWSKRISNCELFFLDTRSHRQVHDRNDPFKPGVSLLGVRQKQWLKRSMAASDADFLFVISSVNLMVPHVGPGMGGANKDEAWTAVAAEREEMIEFWNSLGKPVFVLTGDLHNSFVIKVSDRVWEFASGPHNSANHAAISEAGRPPNGVFESRGRQAEIRWSTYFLDDSATPRREPAYCVVQVNNVLRNRLQGGGQAWIAYPKPQVIFQYYSGLTGRLLYAESVLAVQ